MLLEEERHRRRDSSLPSQQLPLPADMAALQTVPAGNGAAVSPSADFSAALYTFLDKLSPSMVGRLYEAPASCLSLFRCVRFSWET